MNPRPQNVFYGWWIVSAAFITMFVATGFIFIEGPMWKEGKLWFSDVRGDKEQLIQAVLNIAHNAAQALAPRIEKGDAELIFRTRIARSVTLAKVRYRLALDLHIIDNGPGIPPALQDRLFLPLVSGREGGSGLGLHLAQTFVQQHHGLIEFESEPGNTDFKILIPLP